MQIRDDRRHAEFPFKTEPQIQYDTNGNEHQGERAVFHQLASDLRPHEFDTFQLDRGIELLELFQHLLRERGASQSLFYGQTYQYVTRRAEVLHADFAAPQGRQSFPYLVEFRRLLV